MPKQREKAISTPIAALLKTLHTRPWVAKKKNAANMTPRLWFPS